MGAILLLAGYILGEALIPGGGGGETGLFMALVIWVVWSVIGYFQGGAMLLALSRAKEVTPHIHPQLFNVVEEMKIAASLPAMPKIYIIDDEAPNAFATGRKPEKSVIVVTAGLLNRLNRTELQGVIAHEMSHILNRDILFMTFAGVMLGTVVMMSEIFLRGLWFSGGSGRRFRSRNSDRGSGAVIMVIAIVLAILAPILSRIFYFSISRKREYLADASGARLTRYPEGLASALEKISGSGLKFSRANSITAPMYIVNPLEAGKKSLTGLFSTHPPVEQRIKILRSMSRGVNYVNYQSAFRLVTGKGIVPPSGLKDSQDRPFSKPAEEPAGKQSPVDKKRELGDLIRVMNGFVFLTCTCGLKMKLPPGFKQSTIECPRCKRSIAIPRAEIAALSGVAAAGVLAGQAGEKKLSDAQLPGGVRKPAGPLTYTRKTDGWESISCSCGNHIPLSPALLGTTLRCGKCGREIQIRLP
jgi:heat shock protein HtpX